MTKVVDLLRSKGADVHTIRPEQTVLDAAREMNLRRVGALIVVSSDRTPMGIITERDILMRVVAGELSPSETAVGDVMTTRLITCTTGTPLEELRDAMRRNRIRHMPVLDEGRLCGMVSIGDLNIAEVRVMSETIKYFEQYIYGKV